MFQQEDSDNDKSRDEKVEVVLTKTIPTETVKSPELLDNALKKFSDR